MLYTLIYSDPDGESHFSEMSVELDPVNYAPPAPPLNLSAPIHADRMVFFSVSSGWFGDWHPAPARQFYFQISGELEVQVSDGEIRRFSAGAVMLLEDTSGKGHSTRVLGPTGVEGIFVRLEAAEGP